MIRSSWNGRSLREPSRFVPRIFWTILLGGMLAAVVAYAARAEGECGQIRYTAFRICATGVS